MQLIIEQTNRTRKQIQDAHVRYLWAYAKYLIRITDDENKLRRSWDIIWRRRAVSREDLKSCTGATMRELGNRLASYSDN